MAGGPGNWCGALVQLTSASGPVTGNVPGGALPTVAEFDANFAITIDPTASTNGVAGKWVVRFVGSAITSLTETGHGVAATSGFINLGATSAGIWGGYASSSEARLLSWAGGTRTVAIGHATAVLHVTVDAATDYTCSVGGTTRFSCSATNAIVVSPNGTTGIVTSNTSIAASVAGMTRIVLDATASGFLSPDGSGVVRALNTETTIDNAMVSRMTVGGDDRFSADATTSAMLSPSGSNKVETTNSGTTVTGNVGFYGVSPSAQASAYTQTYSTTTRTNNFSQTSGYTGQDNAQPGSVYAKSADLESLRQAVVTIAGLVNALIDDQQDKGLAG